MVYQFRVAAFGLFFSLLSTELLAADQETPVKTSVVAKPNIIVIVADDLGYADLGVQGATDVKTPNIDTIAKNGVRFTNGYVTGPVCSPTRAGIMTGRYQQRFGHELNPGPPSSADVTFGLPLSETLMPSYFKERGYSTGMVGKWHLGYEPGYRPTERGFDEFYGFVGGAHTYLEVGRDTRNAVLRGTTPVDSIDYLTDNFTSEAVSYINRHHEKPFFLYLAFNATHTPLQAPQKYLDRFPNITDSRRKTFAAMLSALDDGVGDVLKELRSKNLEERTLIVFLADNGGPTMGNTSRNTPLKGYKGSVWEGGVRVPFMMQWKSQLKPGAIYDKPVHSLDILPTALAAAGTNDIKSTKPLDGVNLLPYLTGKKDGAPHDALYWRYGSQWAMRSGDWKLVGFGNGSPQLHNLHTDISEEIDVADKETSRTAELKKQYDTWSAQMAEPAWHKQKGAPKNKADKAVKAAKKAKKDKPGRPDKKARKAMKAGKSNNTTSATLEMDPEDDEG